MLWKRDVDADERNKMVSQGPKIARAKYADNEFILFSGSENFERRVTRGKESPRIKRGPVSKSSRRHVQLTRVHEIIPTRFFPLCEDHPNPVPCPCPRPLPALDTFDSAEPTSTSLALSAPTTST